MLIFDEVVTGFRVSRAQRTGRDDIGEDHRRKDILDLLDFQVTKTSDREKISIRTRSMPTRCRPQWVAALEIVGTTDAYARANRYSDPQSRRINEVFEEEHVPWAAYRIFALAVCWGLIREGVRSVK